MKSHNQNGDIKSTMDSMAICCKKININFVDFCCFSFRFTLWRGTLVNSIN